MKGKFIIIEGIDGSGKGTIAATLANWAKGKKLKILDLKKYWKEKHAFPQPRELQKYDCLISCEPTFSMVGQAIREEITCDNGRNYSALSTAQAFALDREIYYKRVIIPALTQEKYIFQERSILSSLAYQPIQKEPLSLKTIMSLEGNKLALKHRPDIVILAKISPETALQRLKKRTGKKDDSIFEKRKFMLKLNQRYNAPWFIDIFKRRGAKIICVDTNKTLSETIQQTLAIIKNLVK